MTPSPDNTGSNRARQFGRWALAALIACAVIGWACVELSRGDHWKDLTTQLRETLGPPLRSFFAPLDNFLTKLPMSAARASAIGLFVVAGIFAWCMPRKFIYLGAPDQNRWRDLRIWATLVLVPYVIIYYFLGN